MMKARRDFTDRKIEPLAIRKRRQAIEAPQAMQDYLRAQQAARDQMAALRKERLARSGKAGAEVVKTV
jgi:hypothetical protein